MQSIHYTILYRKVDRSLSRCRIENRESSINHSSLIHNLNKSPHYQNNNLHINTSKMRLILQIKLWAQNWVKMGLWSLPMKFQN